MKQIILIVLIAVFTAVNLMAQNSRKAIHIIDGAYVENFDGSQLAGKTVRSYSVDEESNVHIIYTSDYKGDETAKIEVKKILSSKDETGEFVVSNIEGAQIKVINVNTKMGAMDDESIVFVVDGKIVPTTVFKSLDVSRVESMDVVKNKSDEKFKKFAKENTSTVMIITTKK